MEEKKVIKGWRFNGSEWHKEPNFEGIEEFYVVRLVHEDGRTAFGSAPTFEQALHSAKMDAWRKDNPQPVQEEERPTNPDIPF